MAVVSKVLLVLLVLWHKVSSSEGKSKKLYHQLCYARGVVVLTITCLHILAGALKTAPALDELLWSCFLLLAQCLVRC